MRITRVSVASHPSWPALELERWDGCLNVLCGPAGSGKTAIAQLMGQLLYGKTPWLDPAWENAGDVRRRTSLIEGRVHVARVEGDELILRRTNDGSAHGRLQASTTTGEPFRREALHALLADVPPRLLARLYAIDFAAPPSLGDLLAPDLIGPLLNAASAWSTSPRTEEIGRPTGFSGPSSHSISTARVWASDRSVPFGSPAIGVSPFAPGANGMGASGDRLARLFERRDAAARELEERLAATRRDSSAARSESSELERLLGERRRRRDELESRARLLDRQLMEIDQRLRYFSLESLERRNADFDEAAHESQLAEIDVEVARCRAMLSELQTRDAAVRRDLAAIQPDGAADGAASLADQRGTLGVLERLLDDLDAEVAQLAHGAPANQGSERDAHARVAPVAQMLRSQLYALCGQVSEQHRVHRRRQLQAESRQLARSQSDLSEQLEHLLERRQELVHAKRVAHRAVLSLPAEPVASLCRCDGHAAFMQDSPAMQLLNGAPNRALEAERGRRAARRHEIEAVRGELHQAEHALAADQARWEALQQHRRGTLDSDAVDRLRRELAELEIEIETALRLGSSHSRTGEATLGVDQRLWRASDTLAKLTDGRLVQIRLRGDQRLAIVVDEQGRQRGIDELSPAERDQVYLALTLALVAWNASRGVHLPLLLDEPFLRQDRPAAAAMAGVLEAFARQGRQVVAFTEKRDARLRMESLGATLFDLEALREQATSPHFSRAISPHPVAYSVAQTPPPLETRFIDTGPATMRVVREPLEKVGPKLRVAQTWTPSDDDLGVFYLEQNAPLSAFPVMGPQTSDIFRELHVLCVDDLLAADAQSLSAALDRIQAARRAPPDAIRLWQSHMSLMCFIPGVSLNDAQVLTACGVDSPAQFYDADMNELGARIAQWLSTPNGQRFRPMADRYRLERLTSWRQGARACRTRWNASAPRYPWTRQTLPTQSDATPSPASPARHGPSHNGPSRSTINATEVGDDDERSTLKTEHADNRTQRSRRRPAAQPARRSRNGRPSQLAKPNRPLRFLLTRSSPVANAPTIGAKTAERLAQVGIRTVADLLNADPGSTAAELNLRYATREAIADWQRQARLVCCIPELRALGAQILVCLGMHDPQQVAGANVDELYRKVQDYCQSSHGKRLLRDANTPSASKVAEWVACAAHMRPLEAA